MTQRQVPEHQLTFDDYEEPLLCPECKSIELSHWDQKTTFGKHGVKYRDYMICRKCLYVWQWVLPSKLFSPKEQE